MKRHFTSITSMTAALTAAVLGVCPMTSGICASAAGDVNGDGMINAADASLVLAEYARISTGGALSRSSMDIAAYDYNGDGFVDARDASEILKKYAELSTSSASETYKADIHIDSKEKLSAVRRALSLPDDEFAEYLENVKSLNGNAPRDRGDVEEFLSDMDKLPVPYCPVSAYSYIVTRESLSDISIWRSGDEAQIAYSLFLHYETGSSNIEVHEFSEFRELTYYRSLGTDEFLEKLAADHPDLKIYDAPTEYLGGRVKILGEYTWEINTCDGSSCVGEPPVHEVYTNYAAVIDGICVTADNSLPNIAMTNSAKIVYLNDIENLR